MNNNNIENTINEDLHEEDIVYTCYECGEVLDNEDIEDGDVFEYNGNYYCDSCRDDNFVWSEGYSEYIPLDDAVKVYTDGHLNNYDWATESDANNNAYFDDDYQEYFIDSDCGCFTHNCDFICEANYQDNYFYCDHCDDVYHINELNELNGCNYCDDCYSEALEEDRRERAGQLVYSYHSFNDWQEYTMQDEHPDYLIGFELEIDNDDDYNLQEVHDLITDNINCVLMHDGSLSSRGLEIVTHPQSYNYIIDKADTYQNTFDKLISEGFTSHENNRCGLHFHVTRPSDEVVDRIELLLENFKTELIAFSRRDGDRLSQWAEFLSDEVSIPRDELLATCTIKDHKDATKRTRYMALNNTNDKTIEFRFIRGTLKYNTFRASLDLINNIMTIASDLSKDINGITWSDLVNTDACKLYCDEQNIRSNAVAIDNTKKIYDRNEQLKTQHVKVSKLLDNYKKHLLRDYNAGSQLLSTERGEVNNAIDRLYNLQHRLEDASSLINFDATHDASHYAIELQRLANRVSSKYYKIRLNNLAKVVASICVL